MLFGSDGPWLHPGLELHKIRLLRLPSEKEALILGGNALRLLQRAQLGGAKALKGPVTRLREAAGVNGNRCPAPRGDQRLPPPAQEYEL